MPRNTRSRSIAKPIKSAEVVGASADAERAVALDADAVCRLRLEQHLQFLGLTLTHKTLEEILAWATRERPTTTAFSPASVLPAASFAFR